MGFTVWRQSISETATELKTDPKEGLAKEEATRRLDEHGKNSLPHKGKIVWWKILLSQFSSLIVWLLIGAAVIAGFLGEYIDAWAIMAIVLFNAVLGFFQEYRAENSLEALQKLASPTSKVVRGGSTLEIPSDELVPGDLVVLEAGDRVPADGRIVECSHLTVEEASLTGESTPVSKDREAIEGDVALGDRKNMVFLGTTIAAGRGFALISGTGLNTEIGKIAGELLEKEKEQTPLQEKLHQLGKRLVFLCLLVVALIFGLGLLRGSGLVDMLLTALSLAVAAIPEGLPAIVTIALSIGVRKMAENKALVRRLSSVETLGSTSVICTDKTGTLTQSAMTVREIWVDGVFVTVEGVGYAPEGDFSKESSSLEFALKIGVLCNHAELIEEEGNWKIAGDPTEGAILTAAAKAGLWKKELEEEFAFVEENPFDSERKLMSILRKQGEKKLLFVKGAPDVLIEKSSSMLVGGGVVPIDRAQINQANQELASKAYRVLGVAYRARSSEEEELIFVGLIAMIDPPRPEAKEAMDLCEKAGIRNVMVTGDHKETAIAIAKELGMNEGAAVTGSEIDALSDEELEGVTVFSRISAEHKLRIVRAYQAKGKVTAMTGDGVNDAPAVQAADIGVSMGITGTDVTKESSDMIILDDNFASIVRAVELGRGIYDNIVKFVSYLLSSNIAEILVIFVTILLGITGPDGEPFIALLPVQILWMNLVTDGFPAISLAMDATDPQAMQRPPRPRTEEILNKRFSLFVISISLLVTAGALGACYFGLREGVSTAHTMAFTTLIVLQLVRVQMIRSQYHQKLFSNPYLIWALISSFVLQLVVVYVPAFQPIFGTVPLSLIDWGVILGIGVFLWFAGQAVTRLFYKD